jgi:hypothetical protein
MERCSLGTVEEIKSTTMHLTCLALSEYGLHVEKASTIGAMVNLALTGTVEQKMAEIQTLCWYSLHLEMRAAGSVSVLAEAACSMLVEVAYGSARQMWQEVTALVLLALCKALQPDLDRGPALEQAPTADGGDSISGAAEALRCWWIFFSPTASLGNTSSTKV